MKKFPQKGWLGFRATLDRLVQNKIDAYGTTDRRADSASPKSVRTTDNIAVVQDFTCSQDDEVMRSVLCGASCRSTFILRNVCCRVFDINCRLCVPTIIRFG